MTNSTSYPATARLAACLLGGCLLLSGLTARAAQDQASRLKVAQRVTSPYSLEEIRDNAGLFVGVAQYADSSLPPLKYTVNDAVAMTYCFVSNLCLIHPTNAFLAIDCPPEAPNRLPAATDDVQAHYQELRQMGVNIISPTRFQIYSTLQRLKQRSAGSNAVTVGYFSMHGFTNGTMSYVMPQDSSVWLVPQQGIPLDDLIYYLNGAPGTNRFLIVDACRSDSTKGSDYPLSSMNLRSTLAKARPLTVLASCADGRPSYEDEGNKRGVFTHNLLRAMLGQASPDERYSICLDNAFKYAAAETKRQTLEKALPQEPFFQPGEAGSLPVAAINQELIAERLHDRVAGFTNSLGMVFAPVVGESGRMVLFSRHETTVNNFQRFLAESKAATNYSWPAPTFPQGSRHPAVNVSYEAALAFCDWLTQREREGTNQLIETFETYSLPIEREWWQATGVSASDRITHFWGRESSPPPGSGNFAGMERNNRINFLAFIRDYADPYPFTGPVDAPDLCQKGLPSLADNVSEWVIRDNDSTKDWVALGGSWRTSEIRDLTWDHQRRFSNAKSYDQDLGFRCVLLVGRRPSPPLPK